MGLVLAASLEPPRPWLSALPRKCRTSVQHLSGRHSQGDGSVWALGEGSEKLVCERDVRGRRGLTAERTATALDSHPVRASDTPLTQHLPITYRPGGKADPRGRSPSSLLPCLPVR